jgi:ribosomal protein S18 acetylase RimI-like enzyme
VHGTTDIGLIAVDHHPDYIRLRQIFILPEAQGCGIGTAIVRQVIQDARHHGLLVRLQVLKVNYRAKVLYERLGFAAVSETSTHWEMKYSPS